MTKHKLREKVKIAMGFTACWSLAFLAVGVIHHFKTAPGDSRSTAKLSEKQERDLLLGDAKNPSPRKGESNVLLSDPSVEEKWGLYKTEVKKAWDVTKGSKDIVVAVIDTGIDLNHPDLKDNIWLNPGETGIDKNGNDKATNNIDDDGNGLKDDVHGWNFAGGNKNLEDHHGHGTHIAGIIGAKSQDGKGVSGVAPNVSLMVLKYYDPKASGTNNLRATVDAIRYAIKMKVNIINYSGGGTEYSADEFAAVKEAERAGILFVAAAGNERSNSDEEGKKYYPADYDLSNVISVTAVGKKDTTVLASSNYGVRTVDLAAPGENINSTLPNGRVGAMTGTSQATAFVSGVAALIMSHRKSFNFADTKKYILQTGDYYPALVNKTRTSRLLNSYRALTSLDQGVGLNGLVAENAGGLGTDSFLSSNSAVKLNTSALSSNAKVEPTERLAFFGRDLLKVMEQNNAEQARQR